MMALSISAQLAIPMLLNGVLSFMEHGESSMSVGITYAAGLITAVVLSEIASSQYSALLSVLGSRLRGGLSVMIFDKALKLTQPEMAAVGIGKMVNMMEVDCQKMQCVQSKHHLMFKHHIIVWTISFLDFHVSHNLPGGVFTCFTDFGRFPCSLSSVYSFYIELLVWQHSQASQYSLRLLYQTPSS